MVKCLGDEFLEKILGGVVLREEGLKRNRELKLFFLYIGRERKDMFLCL